MSGLVQAEAISFQVPPWTFLKNDGGTLIFFNLFMPLVKIKRQMEELQSYCPAPVLRKKL
jgi:hypothetical protein